ncbi:MAG TPA: hypothetical protein VHY19_05175 [Steroidobacteraceae bacterium]|jgi:hypothetical protein|nr:hypothetical protein [Steroidobacteraceae bacterium]
MNELTLDPGIAALPAGEKQIAVAVLPAQAARPRGEPRLRRRLNARALQTSDGGFRPFRVY